MASASSGRSMAIFSLPLMSMSIVALMVLALAGEAISQDRVVAMVNGQELRQLHLDRVMNEILPMAIFHGGVTEEARTRNMDKAMERLVENELLYQEGIRLGIKPDRKAVNDEYKEAVKRLGGKERFLEGLNHYGVSDDEFRRMLGAPQVVKKVLELEVEKKARVTEDEVRDYYEANKSSHFNVLKRRFSHILLKKDPGDPDSWGAVEEKTGELLRDIREGADFSEVAMSFSEGPRKEKAGDTGYIDKTQILPELSKAGWAMKEGEVSEVIQTIYGFHILKLEEIRPPEAVPFDQAKGQIEALMLDGIKQTLRSGLVESLRSKAEIKVYAD